MSLSPNFAPAPQSRGRRLSSGCNRHDLTWSGSTSPIDAFLADRLFPAPATYIDVLEMVWAYILLLCTQIHSIPYQYRLDRACAFLRWLGSVIRLLPPNRLHFTRLLRRHPVVGTLAAHPTARQPFLRRALSLTESMPSSPSLLPARHRHPHDAARNACNDFKASCRELGLCSKLQSLSQQPVWELQHRCVRARDGSGGRWVGGFFDLELHEEACSALPPGGPGRVLRALSSREDGRKNRPPSSLYE
ncbi:hypothetical protein DFH09DRAFT_1315339 [Mycena vulgaris]|nr:hypothetical protein DFH09DRAFT_1315339 [Mycena vulgaris]